MSRLHRAVLALSGFLGLTACATGEGSFLGMSPEPSGGQTSAALAGEVVLADAAPHLLAVSGTALLPGSRRPAAALLAARAGALLPGADPGAPLAAGTTLNAPLVAGPLLGANARATLDPGAIAGPHAAAGVTATGLLPGTMLDASAGASPSGASVTAALAAPAPAPTVSAGASLSGPLLGVSGSSPALLGGGPTPLLGTAPTAAATLSVGGGATPQTAATRLVATVTGAVARANTTSGGGAPQVTAPTLGGVPNVALFGTAAGLLPVRPGP